MYTPARMASSDRSETTERRIAVLEDHLRRMEQAQNFARFERMEAAEIRIRTLEEQIKDMDSRLEHIENSSGHEVGSSPLPSTSTAGGWFPLLEESPQKEQRAMRTTSKKPNRDPLLVAGVKRGHGPPGMEDENRSTKLLALYSMFFDYEFDDFHLFDISRESVFTAFWVFPMLSHSNWFFIVSIKMFILNVCALVLQWVFLNALEKFVNRFPTFDGTPSLCTYGLNIGGENDRLGPLGVSIAADKSNIEPDYTMLIIRNALVGIMQKLNFSKDDVSTIGPVEYGTEDFTCRCVCLLYFLVNLMTQISDSYRVLKLLWYLPSENYNSWIEAEDPREEGHARFWNVLGKKELDHIKFSINGMPNRFKVVCVLHQLLVLYLIWRCIWLGTTFLMETASIVDLILNSLALTFILEIDERLFAAFASDLSKHVLSSIQPYKIKPKHGMFSDDHFNEAEFASSLEEKYKEEIHDSWFDYCRKAWTRVGRCFLGMALIVFLWWALTESYFVVHCSYHGRFVSGTGPDFFWDALFGGWRSLNVTNYDKPDTVSCVPYPNTMGCGTMANWSTTLLRT